MPELFTIAQAEALLPARIDALCAKQGRALVAIDGMAASGKTTLAEKLCASLSGAFVVHMDDFFLPPAQRGERERTLANADLTRFAREVLGPLSAGRGAVYRPYRCHPVPGYLPPVTIAEDWRVVLVEGAYSLHPALYPRYALRILLCASPATQRARILARNGEAMLARFEDEWIPLENRHIAAHALRALCDVCIDVP